MTASNLTFYAGTPFVASNEVSLDDIYVSDGVTTTYVLVNKTVADLGSTIQAGNVEYYQFNGGFTIDQGSNSFTLAFAPPIGTQIVAPGNIQAVIAAFDQPEVLGVVNPQTASIPLWLIDKTTINNFRYDPLPTFPGIQISIVNLITGCNAVPGWFQMASANPSGNVMTYGATGAPLYLPSISGSATIVGSVSATQNVITVSSSAGFWPGGYITVNIGASSAEDLHVIGVSGNNLILDPTGVTYSHSPGELVFSTGFKLFLQVNIPTNANNNQAVNLYNCALQRLGAIRARP